MEESKSGAVAAEATAKPTAVFKKFKKKKGLRKKRRRRDDSDSDGGASESVIVRKKQRTGKVLNAFSTKTGGKGKDGLLNADIIKSEGAEQHKYAGDATYTLEIDTQHDRDARALLEKKYLQNEEAAAAGPDGKKVYRGQTGYQSFMKQDEAKIGLNKVTGTLGPLRAPANLRNTCRFDYQPDVCKDYKETGFCGFGDTCKFLHDRGDYKAGWQIEKEWQEKQERKRRGEEDSDDDEKYVIKSDEEDELPFACHICREPFTDPIRTNCDHYFCLKCAMQRFQKTSACAVCGKSTDGVFNNAPKLLEKIELDKAEADARSSDSMMPSEEEAEAAAAPAADDGADIGGWEVVNSDD